MLRADLDHLVLAAASAAGESEIVVLGSQSLLGTVADPPPETVRSPGAELYPLARADKAALIDAELGDGSHFHATYGYFAHGARPETVKAPYGWRYRLVAVEAGKLPGMSAPVAAFCLEPHDLVLARCAAGTVGDWEFAERALRAGIVQTWRLFAAVDDLPLDAAHREHVRAMLEGIRPRS